MRSLDLQAIHYGNFVKEGFDNLTWIFCELNEVVRLSCSRIRSISFHASRTIGAVSSSSTTRGDAGKDGRMKRMSEPGWIHLMWSPLLYWHTLFFCQMRSRSATHTVRQRPSICLHRASFRLDMRKVREWCLDTPESMPEVNDTQDDIPGVKDVSSVHRIRCVFCRIKSTISIFCRIAKTLMECQNHTYKCSMNCSGLLTAKERVFDEESVLRESEYRAIENQKSTLSIARPYVLSQVSNGENEMLLLVESRLIQPTLQCQRILFPIWVARLRNEKRKIGPFSPLSRHDLWAAPSPLVTTTKQVSVTLNE